MLVKGKGECLTIDKGGQRYLFPFTQTEGTMEQYEHEIELNYGNEAALNILLLNENGFAEVIDFSERGATCRIYTSHAVEEFERKGVDLFNCLAGQYLRGIPCRLAYSLRQRAEPGKNGKRIYQLEFPGLTDEKSRELKQFIEDGYQYFANHHSEIH